MSIDNFELFYKLATKGWARRTAEHYKSKLNPDGIVSYLWRRKFADIEIHISSSKDHLDIKNDPPYLLYCAEIEGSKTNLGYFKTLDEAKAICEEEYSKKFNNGDDTCPHCGKAV